MIHKLWLISRPHENELNESNVLKMLVNGGIYYNRDDNSRCKTTRNDHKSTNCWTSQNRTKTIKNLKFMSLNFCGKKVQPKNSQNLVSRANRKLTQMQIWDSKLILLTRFWLANDLLSAIWLVESIIYSASSWKPPAVMFFIILWTMN